MEYEMETRYRASAPGIWSSTPAASLVQEQGETPNKDALEREPLLPIHHHFLKGAKVSPSEHTPKTQIAKIFRHLTLKISM